MLPEKSRSTTPAPPQPPITEDEIIISRSDFEKMMNIVEASPKPSERLRTFADWFNKFTA